MYYSQQSSGPAHLANHRDQNPWTRPHFPIPGPQGNALQGPTSPGYAIYNNGVSHIPHHPGAHPHAVQAHPPMAHHHQNSLSYHPSPPNGHALHSLAPPSPAATGQAIPPHWQQQLIKCDSVRQSRSPHHRARASAMASRTVAKSAIPITNPNAAIPIKAPPGVNGTTPSAPPSEASPSTPNAAADHPSSTVAPIQEAPRPTAARAPENTWNSLDMGGIHIKNIPPNSGLFAFTFLTNLYLNHNRLERVPPQISKLRHLELLDLSGNGLLTVPPELGMLTNLKELYLFDNALTTIPAELGTLHQLKTLGVEGNPLDESLKKIVQSEGTPALISYLRDSCPVPSPPPDRIFHHLISAAEREAQAADASTEVVRALCYNILCERCATERLYGYTPAWALAWSYRKELILSEITGHDADFLCLQEIDLGQYDDYFQPKLSEQGYDGVFWPKSRYKTMTDADRKLVDGCATFYKADKYQLIEKYLVEFSQLAIQREDFKKTDDMFNRVLGKDHIAVVCLFENKQTGTRFVVANAHVFWDAAFADVKLVQVALLIEEIDKLAHGFARYPPKLATAGARPPPTYSDGTKIPIILCCDANSVPSSGVYEFLANGVVPADHEDFKGHVYGRYTSEGIRHRLGLKSAYAALGELPMTNYTPSFQGPIDYIWYSSQTLAVNGVLGEVDKDYLERVVGFPNAHFPSDHVALLSEFRVKPQRDSQPSRPPPIFPP